MKRSDLEQYLGQKVTVTVSFPFDTYTGYLHKTEEAAFRNDPNIYLKPKYYFLTEPSGTGICSPLFRCSHVKKLQRSI